jgi:hypothetical protein
VAFEGSKQALRRILSIRDLEMQFGPEYKIPPKERRKRVPTLITDFTT